MQAKSLDALIDKAVKRGMLPTFHFPPAGRLRTEGYMGMAMQAVLRRWAHFYQQVWSVVPRANDALMIHIYDLSRARLPVLRLSRH